MTDWKKRAQELFRGNSVWSDGRRSEVVDLDFYAIPIALQLGQEMADARAEEIAKSIEEYKLLGCIGCPYQSARADAAMLARSTISKKKTREQALEEALLEIARHNDHHSLGDKLIQIARDALK